MGGRGRGWITEVIDDAGLIGSEGCLEARALLAIAFQTTRAV